MNLPAWNIETEYPTLQSKEFSTDETAVQNLIAQIQKLTESIRPKLTSSSSDATVIETAQKILVLGDELDILWYNLRTYVSCLENVDATNEAAKAKSSQLNQLQAQKNQALKPIHLFVTQCDDGTFEKVINHDKLKVSRFKWTQERSLRTSLLTEKEETLVAALTPAGFAAWSDLYFAISGKAKVKIEKAGKTELVGLAQASGMIRGADEQERKVAWQGIQQTWKENEETAAAVVNALAGWRLEVCKKRSHTTPTTFLQRPLFDNRIEEATLNAMWTAVEMNKADIQKTVLLMAKLHGKKKLDPWDLLAPAPVQSKSSGTDFDQAIKIIRTAFGNVSPEFGSFVDMMVKNQWIEARVLPNKGPGAHCTGFLKSKTPRVFQTYLGSNHDISTLAHELGHAYHSWVLRELSVTEMEYPMTLAETASIFAETVLMDEMIQTATTREQKMDFAWANVEGAAGLLLNIPARFEFEKNFYLKRQEGALSARELSEVTDQAWTKWYGDTLSANDQMFWASKMHFSFWDASFYNFPYTFGYLFALSIYARRKELGTGFWAKYTDILRDTGRMTAEALVQKHLGEDIRKPEYWQKAIQVVKSKIKEFEALV
jgi:oligoendopeptidase F